MSTQASTVRRSGLGREITVTWFQGAAAIVALITLTRLAVLVLTDINLGPDEAQYWSWSKEFAFGYFSKPPMLAWTIGATTALCGDSEACIRASSPLLHAITALLLFALARLLFNARTGFWTAIAYITLPAVWFSASIASTDVPLLMFWSLALIGLWQTIETRGLGWAALTGIAIGLGFMSKYAMVYVFAGIALVLLMDRTARGSLVSHRGAVILVLAGAILAPNIAWNMSHDFATVSHTAANASWGGSLFNPGNMAKFIGDQFGVFGPVMFAALLWGLVTLRTRLKDFGTRRQTLFLLAFILPPLIVVTAQAFISRANANWAATAYPAATVLVTAWLVRRPAMGLLKGSILLHSAAGLLLMALLVSPALIEALGRGNDFKRVRAWDDIGNLVQARASEGVAGRPFTAVLVNDRLVYGEMLYYARPLTVPLAMWDSNAIPENHFELNAPLTEDTGRFALFVTRSKNPDTVLEHFARHARLDTVTHDIGGGRTRTFTFYLVEAFKPFAPETAGRRAEETS